MEKICENCQASFLWTYDEDQKYCDDCICHECKGQGVFTNLVEYEGREIDDYWECPSCRGEGHI